MENHRSTGKIRGNTGARLERDAGLLQDARADREDDRRRRLLRVAGEQLPFRQHQVDPRRSDAVERTDGARQLAFKRAQPVDVLLELRLVFFSCVLIFKYLFKKRIKK